MQVVEMVMFGFIDGSSFTSGKEIVSDGEVGERDIYRVHEFFVFVSILVLCGSESFAGTSGWSCYVLALFFTGLLAEILLFSTGTLECRNGVFLVGLGVVGV